LECLSDSLDSRCLFLGFLESFELPMHGVILDEAKRRDGENAEEAAEWEKMGVNGRDAVPMGAVNGGE
jgi:hypothetical protein